MSKLIIAGAGGVGKTTFLRRALISGEYTIHAYEPSPGVMTLSFSHTNTQNGTKYKIDACVTSGDVEEESGDGYYNDAKFAIVMFDLTSKRSFDRVPEYIHKIREVCGDIPIAVHANKYDLLEEKREVSADDMVTLIRVESVKLWQTSSRSNYNLYESLDWLVSTLE